MNKTKRLTYRDYRGRAHLKPVPIGFVARVLAKYEDSMETPNFRNKVIKKEMIDQRVQMFWEQLKKGVPYTHLRMIARHLEDYGSINIFEAANEYGILRLPTLISILIDDYGLNISTEYKKYVNKYKDTIYYSEFILHRDNSKKFE